MKYILVILILFFSIINQSFSYELKVSGSYKYGTWGLKEDDRIEAEYDLKKDAIKKYANEKFKGNKSGYRDFKKVEDLIARIAQKARAAGVRFFDL